MSAYDAIVIGSGLGGLTAGALFARHGKRVLVLERQPTLGGAARTYTHGALTIEASLHELDGLDPEDAKVDLLRELGIEDRLQLIDVGPLYEVRSPMVFLGRRFFDGERPELVATVRRQAAEFGWEELILTCDDPLEAVAFIAAHDPDAAGAAQVERRRTHADN